MALDLESDHREMNDSQGFAGARIRRVVTEDDVEPHGMRCPLCDTELKVGDIQADVFMNIAENPKELTGSDESHIPVVMIVCDSCADRPDLHEAIESLE